MLFVEPIFLFGFLPVVLIALNRSLKACRSNWTQVVVLFASLFFYATWDARSIPILFATLILTYLISKQIVRCGQRTNRFGSQNAWISIGVAINLLVLLIPKYWGVLQRLSDLVPGLNVVGGFSPWFPVGMSFFAFTQIAYLVDLGKQRIAHTNFLTLCAFVTFFPHLVAGPILRPSQTIRELQMPRTASLHEFEVGLQQLVFGIAKKTLVADPLGLFIQPFFSAVDSGVRFNSPASWLLITCYALQLYFDFSGYSQMALGLALMMGFRIPVNFDAPYRSLNIIDFWRRWHISLSDFLRDYLYIPLGGNRKGLVIRNRNLLITMILGGMWHGSTINFAIWGLLHGLYLMLAHGFRHLVDGNRVSDSQLRKLSSWLVTLVAVLIAWVPFRVTGLSATVNFWGGLFSTNGGNAISGASTIVVPLVLGCIWLYREPRTRVADDVVSVNKVSVTRIFLLGLLLMVSIAMHGNTTDFLYARF
jgi:alginate O-acetyltransferase complex protein AlgI